MITWGEKKNKNDKEPFPIRNRWRDPMNPSGRFYQYFNGHWEICGYLAEDVYKVFAIVQNEETAKAQLDMTTLRMP